MGPINPNTERYQATTFEHGDGLDLHKSNLPLKTHEQLLEEALKEAVPSRVGNVATSYDVNSLRFAEKPDDIAETKDIPVDPLESVRQTGAFILWARKQEEDIPRAA